MLEEDDLQRKELQRLLSSASDEARKNVIRAAIDSLDSASSTETSTPTLNANRLIAADSPAFATVPAQVRQLLSTDMMARMRPASAHRRPSMPNILDAIPEAAVAGQQRGGVSEEMTLSYDDIAEVVCSSFDLRFNPKSIFRNTTTSFGVTSPAQSLSRSWSSPGVGSKTNSPSTTNTSSSILPHRGGAWTSTGLVPQFVVITFYEKWAIRRIELLGVSLADVAVHLNFSATTIFSPAKLLTMKNVGEDRFSIDLTDSSNGSVGDKHGVSALSVTIVIRKARDTFFGLRSVKIIATTPT